MAFLLLLDSSQQVAIEYGLILFPPDGSLPPVRLQQGPPDPASIVWDGDDLLHYEFDEKGARPSIRSGKPSR